VVPDGELNLLPFNALSDKAKFEGEYFLRRATQVKNVWVPYGA